jgi:hypothetical protein
MRAIPSSDPPARQTGGFDNLLNRNGSGGFLRIGWVFSAFLTCARAGARGAIILDNPPNPPIFKDQQRKPPLMLGFSQGGFRYVTSSRSARCNSGAAAIGANRHMAVCSLSQSSRPHRPRGRRSGSAGCRK